jgi:hypothetical protein
MKKNIEAKIAKLVSEFEKENDLEVCFIDIQHDNGVGFNTSKKDLKATIKIQN